MQATQQGIILWTAAYMSPEQASATATDKRADIWSFGVVLFEMLTGRQVFAGETVSHVLAAVLAKDPNWEALPANLHPKIKDVLRRCLEKDPKNRYRDIGDISYELRQVGADPNSSLVEKHGEAVQVAPQSKVPWVVAVLGILIASVASWTLRPLPPPDFRPVRRFSFALPDDQRFIGTTRRVIAVSPDGLRFVYSGSPSGLYLRSMDEPEARLIPGSQNDTGGNNQTPVFSPDSQSIAYSQGGQLRRIATTGGISVALCDLVNIPHGTSWDVDDTIVYGQLDGIWRVSANGGTPERIVERQEGETLAHPQLLPGGEWLLFTVNLSQIVVQSLESGERKVVLEDGADGRYVPTGHLVYVFEDVLFAAPFDMELLELTGAGVPLIEDIGIASNSGAGQFSIANDGTLVYTTPFSVDQASNLVWVDREGATTPIIDEPLVYQRPRISPDEQRVAIGIISGTDRDIWIIELQGERRTRLTVDPADDLAPLWTRDGSRVTFSSDRDGVANTLYWTPADGSGAPELLAATQTNMGATSWSPEGETLLYYAVGAPYDLWTLNPGEEPKRFLSTPFTERGAVFSPDGQWVAYASNETGRSEIYVTPYPGPGAKITISTEGGRSPLWPGDGRELFYRNEDQMMLVTISTDSGFRVGIPEILFEGSFVPEDPRSGTTNYDVTPDGQRFLMLEPSFGGTDTGPATPDQINIVLNWSEELKERVPVP